MADNQSSNDGYVVVARRYRPRSFAELVGQNHVAQALGNAIETGRVGHAYLFTGARGVGKTSTARIFAKCLNDPGGPTITPDGQSDVAQAVDAGEDIDVIEIDGASNRGIDEIRQLRSTISVRPSRARYKIYIIDEVHMLTSGAFNALLKTLEEPPEHVKFIFCTTDPEKIPITVLSRCQRFDFVPVGTEDILGRLREIVEREGAQASDDALRLLARRAGGSMRDSQSLLEQVLSFSAGEITVAKIHSVLGSADDHRIAELATVLCNRDAAGALTTLDQALLSGIDSGQLAEQLLGYFRDLMVAAVGGGIDLLRYTLPADHEGLIEKGKTVGLQTNLAIVQLLDQAVGRMRQSVHSRILLETALVQICYLPDLQRVADLAAAVMSSGGRAAMTPPPRSAPPAVAAEKKNIEPAVPVGSATLAAARVEPMRTASVAPQASGSALTRPDPARVDPLHGNAPKSSHVPSVSVAVPAKASSSIAAGTATVGPRPSSAHEPLKSSVAPVGSPLNSAKPSAGAKVAQPATSTSAPSETAKPMDPSVKGRWEAALDSMEDMTADYARAAIEVTMLESNRLRVGFAANQQLNRTSCERPERKLKLEQAVTAAFGRPIHLEFVTLAATQQDAPKAAVPTAVSRVQRMRALEHDPLIRRMKEIFEVEILKVEEPRTSR